MVPPIGSSVFSGAQLFPSFSSTAIKKIYVSDTSIVEKVFCQCCMQLEAVSYISQWVQFGSVGYCMYDLTKGDNFGEERLVA